MDSPSRHDDVFAIRAVTRITGLPAATIRAWERRYNAVTPTRSDGNARRYSASEVARLALLAELVAAGHTISAIAGHSDDDLRALRTPPEPATPSGAAPAPAAPAPTGIHERVVRDYLAAIRAFDARAGRDLLGRVALLVDPLEFARDIALPLLRDVGAGWEGGRLSVAHEHLVSAQLREVLGVLMRFHAPPAGAPKAVFTTPSGHRHEFGILAGALFAFARGVDPVYLGPDLPEADIREALRRTRARVLVLSVVRDLSADELAACRGVIGRLAGEVDTWVGLPPHHPLVEGLSPARAFHDFGEYDMALTKL